MEGSAYIKIEKLKAAGIHIFLMAVTVTCLFPLFWMVRASFMRMDTIFTDKSLIPSVFHYDNYFKAWVEGNFGVYLFNSLIYTVSVVAGIVLIASLAAYAFSRLRFPGKDFFFYMFVLSMMIPLPGSFVPLYVMMNKLGLVNTRLGYILCMINVGLSMSILILKTFFDKMPSDLEDAAKIDGCGHLGIWWHVALPLARPAIAVIVIFNSLNVWNEYILAQLLLNDRALMPLQRGIMLFHGTHSIDYPVLMAGLTIAAIPIVLLYLVMQKHIINGLTSGGKVIRNRLILFLACFSLFSFPHQIGADEALIEGAQTAPAIMAQEGDEYCPPEEPVSPEVFTGQLQDEPQPGVSTDELVKKAWAASGKSDLEKINAIIAQFEELYSEDVKSQQAILKGFPRRGEEGFYKAFNDYATCLFIQAEALKNLTQKEEAIKAFEKIITDYQWSEAWDPSRGSYWSIAEKSRDSIDVMTNLVGDGDFVPQKSLRTKPYIHTKGTEQIIDYTKYGTFNNVGTDHYKYSIADQEGLSAAVGEAIYPNESAIYNNPRREELRKENRLQGGHWDYVNTDDLEAAYFKWATAPEPWGVKLFYLGMIFEKAEMYYEALKAYHTLIVHFPNTTSMTYWQTPWYPAQAAVSKIRHIIRSHPEMKIDYKWMSVVIQNSFDNSTVNDITITYPGKIINKGLVDKVKEKLNIEKCVLGKVIKQIGSGKVHLVQYENGHWQLLVDEAPYVIKGLTYAPTKVGQSPDKGTLADWMIEDTNGNGMADGPYDSWVDKNENNNQDMDELVVGDFELMKEMGVNTIRIYHNGRAINKELLRQMYYKYGMRVIIGDFVGKYAYDSGADWFEGTDYENPVHKKNLLDSVKKMVVEHKDEPYVLFWLLGNENNYGVGCNADKKPEAYYRFLDEVAQYIKSLDKEHPVAVSNGDTLYLDLFAKYSPNVDIFGANVYRGDYGFGAFWQQVADATGRPAIITEYGCPAFAKHLTLDEAEHAQMEFHEGNWIDIEENLAGRSRGVGNALGGVAFEWMDEWWKNYEPFRHDRKSDVIGPFPGGYYFEEWFGLVGQGNGQSSPFLRHLRPVYYFYKEAWNKKFF